jgi:hypothetical protein
MFDGNKPPSSFFLVKYGRKQFLEPMLREGRIRVRIIEHCDKIRLRVERPLTDSEHRLLDTNTEFVDFGRGKATRGSNADWLVTVVAPNEAALEVLAGLPESTFVNYAEPAQNMLMPNAVSARALTWHAARTFARPRHGKHQLVLVGAEFAKPKKQIKRKWRKGRKFEVRASIPAKSVLACGSWAIPATGANERSTLMCFILKGGIWGRLHVSGLASVIHATC